MPFLGNPISPEAAIRNNYNNVRDADHIKCAAVVALCATCGRKIVNRYTNEIVGCPYNGAMSRLGTRVINQVIRREGFNPTCEYFVQGAQ